MAQFAAVKLRHLSQPPPVRLAWTMTAMVRNLQYKRLSTAVAAAILSSALLAACGGSNATTATTASTPATTSSGTATSQATPSHAVSEHLVTAASGAVTASLTAAGHSPRVGVPWPIRFAVKSSDKPARAEVRYEYMFGGAVVAHRSHYKFTGDFHDTFNWPTSAVGYPLTFRAVTLSEGVTLNLDYPVQVRR